MKAVSRLLWRLDWSERNGAHKRRSFSSNKALLQCARQIAHKAFTFRLEAINNADDFEEMQIAVRSILTGTGRLSSGELKRTKIAKWLAKGATLGVFASTCDSRTFSDDAEKLMNGERLVIKFVWNNQRNRTLMK